MADQQYDDSFEKYRFNSPSDKYSIHLSYRKFLWRFVFLTFLFIKASILYAQSDSKIFRLFQILQLNDVPKWGPMFWKSFLNTKIPSEYVVQYPLLFLMIFILIYMVWLLLVCKTTKITINSKFIEVREGVLNRKIDSINLVDIRDEPIEIPWYDRIIKLSHLNIKSTDKTTPNLNLSGLDAVEAEHFMNFIRINAYQNYTDYRISKDRRENSIKKKNKKNDEVAVDNEEDIIVERSSDDSGDENG